LRLVTEERKRGRAALIPLSGTARLFMRKGEGGRE